MGLQKVARDNALAAVSAGSATRRPQRPMGTVGVASKTGLAHSAVVTAAHVRDKRPLPDVLHGRQEKLDGDSACRSRRELVRTGKATAVGLGRPRVRNGNATEQPARPIDRAKSRVRARLEHVWISATGRSRLHSPAFDELARFFNLLALRPLAVHFSPVEMGKSKYDEVIRRLAAEGAGAPAGRLHHCCYDPGDGQLCVVDVFDSERDFETFGKTLVPILVELRIDVGRPGVSAVHNIIRG